MENTHTFPAQSGCSCSWRLARVTFVSASPEPNRYLSSTQITKDVYASSSCVRRGEKSQGYILQSTTRPTGEVPMSLESRRRPCAPRSYRNEGDICTSLAKPRSSSLYASFSCIGSEAPTQSTKSQRHVSFPRALERELLLGYIAYLTVRRVVRLSLACPSSIPTSLELRCCSCL